MIEVLKMSLDSATKTRLVYAKRLLIHGINHANEGTALSRMIAVHNLDNAIEWLLGCIETYYNVPINRKTHYQRFLDYWNIIDCEVVDKIGKNLPLKTQIEKLHDSRNGVQHHGLIPSIEDVNRFKFYAEDFFRQACDNVFQIPYDELYLSTLIDDDKVRDLFIKSEAMFSKGAYLESLKSVALAFAISKRKILEKLEGEYYDLPYSEGDPFQLNATIMYLHDKVNILTLGIDYKKYSRFKEVTPEIYYGFESKEPNFHYTEISKNPEKDDVIFCLEFTLESILEWQEMW